MGDEVELAPSSNKSPMQYDDSLSKLGQEYLMVAEKALNESEAVRRQSLAQLRKLIRHDARIIRCRTDATFLLRFLRVKKFNVKKAHDMLHRYLASRQLNPSWFSGVDVTDPRIEELLDLGAMTPLRKRDAKGRQIWIYKFGSLVPGKHTSTDFIRLQEAMYQTCVDDEETQICGLVVLVDYTGMTMKHLTIFSLMEFKAHISCIRETIPMRVQVLWILNPPKIVQIFHAVMHLLISAKLRERFKVSFDVTILGCLG